MDGGGAFIVEPWLLSSMPVDEVLGLLRSKVPAQCSGVEDGPASNPPQRLSRE